MVNIIDDLLLILLTPMLGFYSLLVANLIDNYFAQWMKNWKKETIVYLTTLNEQGIKGNQRKTS